MVDQRIQLRRGLSARWAEVNPILASGELGVEMDTKKIKIGDGFTEWNSLAYTSSGSSDASGVKSVMGRTGDVFLSKADVGLTLVDNTSDSSKPVSTAQAAALAEKIDNSRLGVANGAASLDATGKLYTSQLGNVVYIEDMQTAKIVNSITALDKTQPKRWN